MLPNNLTTAEEMATLCLILFPTTIKQCKGKSCLCVCMHVHMCAHAHLFFYLSVQVYVSVLIFIILTCVLCAYMNVYKHCIAVYVSVYLCL